MIRLQTKVDYPKSKIGITYDDNILILGSCFADNIGDKMKQAGFNVCVNPFGTLYNPVSIANSLTRLKTGKRFTIKDCVQMGAGSNLICSFSHHTSFARASEEEFLDNANARLAEACEFYRNCNKIIITFGTAWVFRHIEQDMIVSNCLKRNATEFVRERLTVDEITKLYTSILSTQEHCSNDTTNEPSCSNDSDNSNDYKGSNNTKVSNSNNSNNSNSKQKQFIFTVSPIRHFKDGAHGNQVSKSTLLLATDALINQTTLAYNPTINPSTYNSTIKPDIAEYFPSYEIMLDELRDYRFYAEDMIHPSDLAVKIIWERFCEWAIPAPLHDRITREEKLFRQSQHRPMHQDQ